MKSINTFALLSLLILSLTACKNEEKGQPVQKATIEEIRDIFNKNSTTNTYQSDSTQQQSAAGAVVHSTTTHDSDRPNRHGYAERKKTDELEEEYYDAFGDNYLYDIDDEEYEAGEQEYDYDD